mgnify:CR=1 FL=1
MNEKEKYTFTDYVFCVSGMVWFTSAIVFVVTLIWHVWQPNVIISKVMLSSGVLAVAFWGLTSILRDFIKDQH